MSDINHLTIKDTEYPDILKEINDPPKQLYWRGNIEILGRQPAIAVVGTRRCSSYGIQATQKIVNGLAGTGIVIVSGMANGIDTCAHETALEAGLPTVAVLGTGIDEESIYPKRNKPLAKRILEEGGLLLSEYEPGTPGHAGRFPQRNRIVAALTLGTLVTEAPEKSGSQITARLALEYNRDVWAVPGSVFSRLSEVPNKLIAQGAACVREASDILNALGIDSHKQKEEALDLNEDEQNVLTCIKESAEALHLDKIVKTTKLGADEVSEIIATLLLYDAIQEADPNHYIAK